MITDEELERLNGGLTAIRARMDVVQEVAGAVNGILDDGVVECLLRFEKEVGA